MSTDPTPIPTAAVPGWSGSLVVEFDETHHAEQEEQDAKRQKEIEVTFIRVSDGEEVEGLRCIVANLFGGESLTTAASPAPAGVREVADTASVRLMAQSIHDPERWGKIIADAFAPLVARLEAEIVSLKRGGK